MIARLIFFLIPIGLLFCFMQALAGTPAQTGMGFSYALIGTEPKDLQGYRISLWYQPDQYKWSYIKLFFDGSFGHWWVDQIPKYRKAERELNSYAIAPIARFYYQYNEYFTPFIDMSIGVTYLSETYMSTRNLGMHFSFQDQLGIGALLGTDQKISVSVSAIHYSNASLCTRNSGMTSPLMMNIGFRF